MSTAWSYYIIAFVLLNIIGCAVFLFKTTKQPKSEVENELHGHIWDDDLQELNNPLPRWWLILFYLTIVFSIVYLVLYPGLGDFPGVLNWQSTGAYQEAKEQHDQNFQGQYDKFLSVSVEQLAKDPKALQTAYNLFQQHCAACHGSDARGAPGFPNLTDQDSLYGMSAQAIKETLLNGRRGVMPAFAHLSPEELNQVTTYILNFSGRAGFDKKNIAAGQTIYNTQCSFCHGQDAKGNMQLGAPNLTDDIWLYGGEREAILSTLTAGRQGAMPAFGPLISESKIHLLTAYVLSLSQSN